jgi:hypothetical protein
MKVLDLIVRNATLTDGQSGLDIGIAGGRIAVVLTRLGKAGRKTVQCAEARSTPIKSLAFSSPIDAKI